MIGILDSMIKVKLRLEGGFQSTDDNYILQKLQRQGNALSS